MTDRVSVTDPSTSPVPPKEIEEAIWRYRLAAFRLGQNLGHSPTMRAEVSQALVELRAAIASYTLSPEEARIAYHAVAPSGLLAAHLTPEERAAAIKLERIASTEEASQ